AGGVGGGPGRPPPPPPPPPPPAPPPPAPGGGAGAPRPGPLGWAADQGALVFPAHLGGHGAAAVRRSGAGFAIERWAPFARL
ncbi:hypothetical protein AAHZ94_34850, partial [Streptomyces sp. HSW2009]